MSIKRTIANEVKSVLKEQNSEYYISYTRVFNITRGYHKVEVFKTYTKANGLADMVNEKESGRANELLNFLKPYSTPVQLKKITRLMKEYEDGIVSPTGEYFRY